MEDIRDDFFVWLVTALLELMILTGKKKMGMGMFDATLSLLLLRGGSL